MSKDKFNQMIEYLETEAQETHITPTDQNSPTDWSGETILCATYRLPSIPVSYIVWYCWDSTHGIFSAYELTAHGVHMVRCDDD